jgi:hypothetical protein
MLKARIGLGKGIEVKDRALGRIGPNDIHIYMLTWLVGVQKKHE